MGAAGSAQHKFVPDPGLYIVSTPIGNLRDITLRALDVLNGADEVLAEDTRVAAKLFSAYAVKTPLSPYHDHNGAQRRPAILARLAAGARIALISDAGTPLISDPGWKLVREAVSQGIRVSPVPGASALLAGLVVSGLPSDRFLFAGFLPPKAGARRNMLETLASVPATLAFFESGARLAESLEDIASVLGATRQGVVARELTKLFEETRRGTLRELADHYRVHGPARGELVVLAGPPAEMVVSRADLDAALQGALSRMPTKEAARHVADMLGLSRRDVYQRAIDLRLRDET